MPNIFKRDFSAELKFNFSRSSGPGGQHVNKTESKVELRFNILQSKCFSEKEKERLKIKLSNKINNEGELILTCQESRSQIKNKEIVTARFLIIIENALRKNKKRIPTKPTQSSIEKRLKLKKRVAENKNFRKIKPDE